MPGRDYDHRWENDIDTGTPDPLRGEFAMRSMFETLRRQGVKPEQLFDKTVAAEYTAYLCDLSTGREPETLPRQE